MAMAYLVQKEVEIIEVGTPLNKAEGMRVTSPAHGGSRTWTLFENWSRWVFRHPLQAALD